MTGKRAVLAVVTAMLCVPPTAGAQQPGRVLGSEEIRLYGMNLRVEPERQTVPRDVATIVSTFLQAPQLPDDLPPFAADAEVRATLRGPAFAAPVELRAVPNSPLNIPPLPIAGTYTVENIRLVSGGEVLLRAVPEHATIDVIEQLLVTQVTARALTAQEIREKGIVFDKTNFQAYNFTAAFAIQDRVINLDFPVVLPRLDAVGDVPTSQVGLPAINTPSLPSLKTIIPDTLKLQTRIPNLSVVGFTMKVKQQQGQQLVVPPIPGVIVIPGDIGFLNQYFSVMLMVGNAAPPGSNLVVDNVRASIVLPRGRDNALGTPDDPLGMARTATGNADTLQVVAQPGPDGRLGTSDDVLALAPGESGNAEYLVEGRREGSHQVEMAISATLQGLPVGPVEVQGRALGAVLVRNPAFALTFTHPEVVSAGENYTLDVTVNNTGAAPANFVSLNLSSANVGGATIVGPSSQDIEHIAPGDSATVSFTLTARRSGRVVAATLDGDGNVAGRFGLKTSVGELGVPLSPDSLVLPKEARSLPDDLEQAAIGVLGKAYSVATAPPAAIPQGLSRFTRQVVIDRAVDVAAAGLRHSLGEPAADAAAQLLMDFAGSGVARLPQRYPDLEDRTFAESDFAGFDVVRRLSVRGDTWASAIGAHLAPSLTENGTRAFHAAVAERWSYRPPHISIVVSSTGGALPARIVLRDAHGRALGGVNAAGKVRKDIPYGEFLDLTTGGIVTGQMAIVAAPQAGRYTLEIESTDSASPIAVSIVVPSANGHTQTTFNAIAATDVPAPVAGGGVEIVSVRVANGSPTGGTLVPASSVDPVNDPAPSVLGVFLRPDADQLTCDAEVPGVPAGRVLAVLFSEEVDPASVQDRLAPEAIQAFLPESNRAVAVALQPGGRIAYVALRDPVGPHVTRQLRITGVRDLKGGVMADWVGPIVTTGSAHGGVVSGRVLEADGSPVPYANVRLFYKLTCDLDATWVGISSKHADEHGAYSFDHVLSAFPSKLLVVDPETQESRQLGFAVQRDGQRLNVDVVFLGRGTFAGITLSESGQPLAGTAIRLTSTTDGSSYGATSGPDGRFSIARVPVGPVFVEAVNVAAKAQVSISEAIPFAGAQVSRDIVLQNVDTPELQVKYGAVVGHALRRDQATPVPNVPVIAYYKHLSQPGLRCPGSAVSECAIALVNTNTDGSFNLEKIPAGHYRLSVIDQDALQQGETQLVLVADTTLRANVLLNGGLATVKGVVVDAGDNPVKNARVGGGLSLTTADDNGRFTLEDVPVGRREIVAVSDALGSRGSILIDIPRAGETVETRIVLGAVGGVSGVITQANGQPSANTKVYLFRRAGAGIDVVATATTAANGAYQMTNVPAGEYVVSAFNSTVTDGNVAAVVIRAQDQVVRADLRFRGGNGVVTGTVLDADGLTPLAARVGITGERIVVAGGQVGVGFETVQNWAIVDTDPQSGRFQFNGVFVGPFTLQAAGAFSPDPISVERELQVAGQTVDVPLRLQSTSQIGGTLFMPDGVTPVTDVVGVTYKSAEFKTICTGTDAAGERVCESVPQGIQELTDATESGRFWFPLVNAGDFTLTVSDEQGRIAQARGTVKPGDVAEIALRLLNRPPLSVQVLGNDKQPVAGARVRVTQVGFPRKSVELTADESGVAIFDGADGFVEGDLTIEARDGQGFAGRTGATLTSSQAAAKVSVHIMDAVGSVAGTVYDWRGATPVPNAEVVLTTNGHAIGFAVTGADGRYAIANVPLGAFAVDSFEARTARRAFATGQVSLGGQAVVADLVQESLGVITGRVLDSRTLLPLKGWTVRLQQASLGGRSLPSLQTTSSADGTFSFPAASRGDFQLTATRRGVTGSGAAGGSLDGEGGSIDVPILATIVRRLEGTVAGQVLTSAGAIAGNAQVRVCPAQACENWDHATVVSVDPDTGRFALPGVPVGRFLVRASMQQTGEAGMAAGQITLDGEVTDVTVAMRGVVTITGEVRGSNGPVAGAEVVLRGQPDPGCPGGCLAQTDGSGRFTFIDVPVEAFTLEAFDSVSSLKGSLGGRAVLGAPNDVMVMLEPTSPMTGRVVTAAGVPAAGIVAELILGNGSSGHRLYAETDADGRFTFAAAKRGLYTLTLNDPLGLGLATRAGEIVESVDLGTIALDEAAPIVVSMTPGPGATTADPEAPVVVTFSEPILRSSIGADDIVLESAAGPVLTVVDVADDDRSASIRPLAPLATETSYTVRVLGLLDLERREMGVPYVATFSTWDKSIPAYADISPAQDRAGVAVTSVIRIKYSEPIVRDAYEGTPISVTGPAGAVEGTVGFSLGDTVAVFTPRFPLAENTPYQVRVAPARDLAGNAQAAALVYSFTTTDRTAPELAGLTVVTGPTVIEHHVATVRADIGANLDVAFVDFYVNGSLAGTDRGAPFEFSFAANAAAGQTIAVAALATDFSGNQGNVPADASVAVTADQPPALTIVAPASTIEARNGQRIDVTVRASDDIGVARVGYRAQPGQPIGEVARDLPPTQPTPDQHFSFLVPSTAEPGSAITIEATAVDTKGQIAHAFPIEVRVLDAVAPHVAITSPLAGARVAADQNVTVVVTATDLGRVKSITFNASGIVTRSETRAVDPAQSSVATSFTVKVPAIATPGQQLHLEISAVDVAGNSATATRSVVVDDKVAPTVELAPEGPDRAMTIGGSVKVRATAQDGIALGRIVLTGSGAFTYNAEQTLAPTGAGFAIFDIPVDPNIAVGSTLTLQAVAFDAAGNESLPAALTLTAVSNVGVTLPPSAIVNAGDKVEVIVTLAADAPASGTTVELSTTNASIAFADPVVIPAGERTATAEVFGVSGGSATLRAVILGQERASMTVTVNGGIVRGIVRDPLLDPVGGATVVVSDGGRTVEVQTESDGSYLASGLIGPRVFVTVTDTSTLLYGYGEASMAQARGFATVSPILISAGSIAGIVTTASGESAGAGVVVDIYDSGDMNAPVGTTFTDEDGRYAFPLVTLGDYVLEAASSVGRGRITASVTRSGEAVNAPIAFIGTGAVAVTVHNGGGGVVANARVTLSVQNVFGRTTLTEQRTDSSGTTTFSGVQYGAIQVQAQDEGSLGAGAALVTLDASSPQPLGVTVTLSSYATLRGVVTRPNSTSKVVGASVVASTSGFQFTTTTDINGEYRFERLPLAHYTVTVSEEGTRGKARDFAKLLAHGVTYSLNLQLLPQGRLLVTVKTAGGVEVPSANVSLRVEQGEVRDFMTGVTDGDGEVLFDHVLAGAYELSVRYGNLGGRGTGTLAPDEIEPVTVHLVPTGTVFGEVYQPGGQAPFTEGRVLIGAISVPIVDGSYRVENLPVGTYKPIVYDARNKVRAFATDADAVVLTTDGQEVQRNFTVVALAKVSGYVQTALGDAVIGATVELISANPLFGGEGSKKTVTTTAGGAFTFADVWDGPFTLHAVKDDLNLIGDLSSEVPADGTDVTGLVITMTSNAIALPVSRYDANAHVWEIQPDGTIRKGNESFNDWQYSGLGASALRLRVNGVELPFTGSTTGTREDADREIATRQLNLGGLDVTRKIYVPRDGYFARMLEILRNPTESDIAVDVVVQHRVRGRQTSASPVIGATSSGDALPDDTDRWVAFQRHDTSQSSWIPARVVLLDGAGADDNHDGVSLAAGNPALFASEWHSITVPAGQAVALMHVLVQQQTDAAAMASVERLAQMPPELLRGLSEDERFMIRNFDIPGDGQSTLAVLPGVNGTITGRVLEADDDETPVWPATVTFTSDSPYFTRTFQRSVNQQGQFTFSSTDGDFPTMTIAEVPFTLRTSHPHSKIVLDVPGAFAAGQTSVTQNVVFAGTGMVEGVVQTFFNQAVTSGTVVVQNGAFSQSVNITSSGFRMGGVPAGTYTLTAFAGPDGGKVSGTAEAVIVAGETTVQNIKLEPTGTLSGVLQTGGGAPIASRLVYLRRGTTFVRTAQTSNAASTLGQFTFVDVPEGNYTLEAKDEGRTLLWTRMPVTVTGSGGNPVTFNLTAVGTVSGQLRLPNLSTNTGVMNVTIVGAHPDWSGASVQSSATGVFTFSHVPAGAFTVRVLQDVYAGEANGSLTTEGQNVSVEVQLASSGVPLPATRYDANGFPYDIRQNGTIGTGRNYLFNYAEYPGAALEITTGGQTVAYNGGSVARGEEDKQQLVTLTQLIGGLQVQRKVYVPRDGYFARYLEVLTNPTSEPITVSVRVRTRMITAFGAWPQILGTSSGDTTLALGDMPDRWVTFDDHYDEDPFESGMGQYNRPPAAFTFDGEGGVQNASAAVWDNTTGTLRYEWQDITIAPGETVALMHFVTQQMSHQAAIASAERLTQAPPEALVGLSAEDLAAVRNFALPADGTGTVEPLMSLQGTAHIRVEDGAGGGLPTWVSFRSDALLFQRTRWFETWDNGELLIHPPDSGDDRGVVPVAPFTVTAEHPYDSSVTATAAGTFNTATQHGSARVTFSGTGTIWVSASTATGGVIEYPVLTLDGRQMPQYVTDFGIPVTGVAAGEHTLALTMKPHPGYEGTDLTITQTATVPANGSASVHFEFPSMGELYGVVTSTPGAVLRGRVFLESPSFTRSVLTEAGDYYFVAIPAGNYTLRFVPQSGAYQPQRQVSVIADQAVEANLEIPALGTLQGTVTYAGGAPWPSHVVQLHDAGGQLMATTVSTAAGAFTFSGVPLNLPMLLRSTHDLEPRAYGEQPFTLTGDPTQRVTVRTVAVGSLELAVRDAVSNAPISGALVYVQHGLKPLFELAATTNASGIAVVTRVPEGPWAVRLRSGETGALLVEQTGTLAIEHDRGTLQVPVAVTAETGVVQGQVVARAGGTPIRDAFITLHDVTGQTIGSATTSADGRFSIDEMQVGQGGFTVRAMSSSGKAQADVAGQVGVDLLLTLDVVVGNVSGIVTAQGDVPVGGAEVALLETSGEVIATAITAADGSYSIGGAAVAGGGAFTARASTPDGSVEVSHEALFATPGDAVVVDFQLPVVATVIQGRLLAGADTVGLPGQRVFVETASGETLAQAITTVGGDYLAPAIYTTDTVIVRSRVSRSGYMVEASQQVAPGATSGTVDVNLSLAATAISGSVRDAVGGAFNVRVTVIAADGNVYREVWRTGAGDYVVLGVPRGPFTWIAHDDTSPIQTMVEGEMPASDAVVVNATVAATGSVTGVFTRGETAYVGLVAAGVAPGFVYWDYSDDVGGFTFDAVPAGPVSLAAIAESAGYYRGTADATVVPGGTTNVSIAPVPISILAGQVTGQGAAYANASVHASGGSGALGSFSTDAYADPQGVFHVVIPSGETHVTVWGEDGALGKASTLASPGPSSVTVLLGNAVALPQTFVHPDGFRYSIDYNGELTGGGSPSAEDPFGSTQWVSVNGWSNCCEGAALVGETPAHLAIGPVGYDAFELTRKVFVSEAGGFVRYVEFIRNTSSVALPVEVALSSPSESGSYTRFIVDPVAGGRRYVVRDDSFDRTPRQATTTDVFAGLGGIAVAPRIDAVEDGNDDVEVTWTFTVPPGESRAVMHFVAQRGVGAGAETQALAESLVNLSAPDALTGLTPAERAMIVNFIVP